MYFVILAFPIISLSCMRSVKAILFYFLNLSILSTAFSAVDIIAHRGASAYAPENTLASVDLALELDADGIEIDVHVSADGRLMVIHDGSTGRTCNEDVIIQKTHSHTLRQLDAGSWKGPEWKDEKIPFLEEVLERVPLNTKLFIECKTKDPKLFLQALEPLWSRHQERLQSSILISFHAPILSAFKREYPEQMVIWLIEEMESLEAYARHIKEGGKRLFDGLGVDHELGISDHDITTHLASGHLLSVWTVDQPRWVSYYTSKGFAFFTTNRPDLVQLNKNTQVTK